MVAMLSKSTVLVRTTGGLTGTTGVDFPAIGRPDRAHTVVRFPEGLCRTLTKDLAAFVAIRRMPAP